MLAETGAALTSIKTAIDMLKSVRALKSETEINLAVIEIQRILLDAQSAAFDDKERQMGLLSRIAELEARLGERAGWEKEQARYRLTEFPTGRLAYVLKDEMAGDEPRHKLCAKCFTEGRKSILQTVDKHSGGESVFCQNCKVEITLTAFPVEPIQRVRRSRYIELEDY